MASLCVGIANGCGFPHRQWRYSQMAISFLVMLIRHDHPLPREAIQMHAQNLVHDALIVRKVGVAELKINYQCTIT
jgi:hypothetical protein